MAYRMTDGQRRARLGVRHGLAPWETEAAHAELAWLWLRAYGPGTARWSAATWRTSARTPGRRSTPRRSGWPDGSAMSG
ncbi:hypothetical protein [Streptomyces albidoflavus]|uniref:hypothetical protein n=1 Tax=Streptomyces albidoflavus TaxID=1886 RepID=UPI00188BBEA1|nr:hypothetical protein [Streptomyces albidoflavus]MBF4137575.1 hypothetical protein [Streptomyces albidoflavus]